MHTRLASYSKLNKKPSAKAIREAYKNGEEFDLQITDFNDPYCGSYISPSQIKALGKNSVFIRYDRDTKIMELKL